MIAKYHQHLSNATTAPDLSLHSITFKLLLEHLFQPISVYFSKAILLSFVFFSTIPTTVLKLVMRYVINSLLAWV